MHPNTILRCFRFSPAAGVHAAGPVSVPASVGRAGRLSPQPATASPSATNQLRIAITIALAARLRAVRSTRFAETLHRHRYAVFAVWWIHVFLFHYLVLGLVTWDGFGYRGFPIVELLQHGTMAKAKYVDWSLAGYTPFLELIHLPFLKLFGMKGFIIGFPLVVFPLCVWAVHALVRELTDDPITATFAAFGYALLPMINQQAFSGYIDFAESGLLALFVYALLRASRSEASRWAFVRLAVATWLFTMARVQALYVAIVVVPIVGYAVFCERDRFRIKIAAPRRLVVVLAVIAIGAIPAIALQVSKYLEFDSPTFPVQFKLLGIHIGSGRFTRDTFFKYAGLGGDDWGSVAKGFFQGWIWHGGWPIGAFYSSRFFAAGLLFDLAIVMVPFVARGFTRGERALIAAGVLVAVITRDLGIPRYSYTLVVALAIVLGRGLAELARSRRGRPAFWAAVVIAGAHLLRPELDLLQFRGDGWVSPHMNVTGSRHYVPGVFDVPPFPDRHGRFVIVGLPANDFVLDIFGRDLDNEVLGSVTAAAVGPHCEQLYGWKLAVPDVLFIDDSDATRACPRECAIPGAPGAGRTGSSRRRGPRGSRLVVAHGASLRRSISLTPWSLATIGCSSASTSGIVGAAGLPGREANRSNQLWWIRSIPRSSSSAAGSAPVAASSRASLEVWASQRWTHRRAPRGLRKSMNRYAA